MVVVFAEPGKLLRLAGGLGPLQCMGLHGVMEWRLAPIEGGTRVTLFYRAGRYTPDDLSKFAPAVDRVQTLQLSGFAAHLRAAPATPGGQGCPMGRPHPRLDQDMKRDVTGTQVTLRAEL